MMMTAYPDREHENADKAAKRPPTPQAISALLKRAGYERAIVQRVTLTAGFYARGSRAHPNAVVVGYKAAHTNSQTATTRKDFLARYSDTIKAAGWTVEAGEYELTVTAGKEER